MTDPAIEAAKRSAPEAFGTRGELNSPNSVRGALAVTAAREALKPIRELHRRLDRATLKYTLDDRVVCSHCLGPVDWPCATGRLIYSESELTS